MSAEAEVDAGVSAQMVRESTPRGHLLAWVAAACALVGLADSIYLTAQHYAGQGVRCAVVTGCNEVLGSEYATVFGVPLAALGALGYFSAFSLATLSAFGFRSARPLLAALVLVMLATTIWLMYVQAFVLGKFCSYCLLSAAVTLTLTGLVVAGKFWRRSER